MLRRVTDTIKRIIAARVALLLDQPFFGALALQLMIIEDDTAPTAWTDGTRIAFNPAFVATLTDRQLQAVLAHEVMHCACGHPWRRDAREPRQWNVAADYAINPILTDAQFELPPGCLNDPQYAGKSAEWIYARLPQQPPSPQGGGQGQAGAAGSSQQQPGGQPSPDPSGLGEVRDAPSTADDPHAQTQEDWQQATQQAARLTQGKTPATFRRLIADATRPATDWRSILLRWLQELTRADYTWIKPARRYLAAGLFLPSLESIGAGRLAVAIDTSGSIDGPLLAAFGAHLQLMVDLLQPSRVDVIMCDAAVNAIDTFEPGDAIALRAVGGGGTNFCPVFDHLAADDDPPRALVYLTDGYGTFPDVAPDYPVIWAMTTDVVAPFGETVRVDA